MFTGIVAGRGEVKQLAPLDDAARLTISSRFLAEGSGPVPAERVDLGESIAVNGVCLTVATYDGATEFTADVMAETLRRSTLGALVPGDRVNLERAVRAQDRLGGHLVQGHVDGVAEVLELQREQHWTSMWFRLPASLGQYVVEKGSIAIDGVSLTVAARRPEAFMVSLIPETLTRTTLGARTVGDRVNLEVDIIAKYVESMVTAYPTGEQL